MKSFNYDMSAFSLAKTFLLQTSGFGPEKTSLLQFFSNLELDAVIVSLDAVGFAASSLPKTSERAKVFDYLYLNSFSIVADF